MHAARRNMDLMVICVNNFTYGMTGGQVAPTTPLGAKQTTMPFGNFEAPFSLPFLLTPAAPPMSRAGRCFMCASWPRPCWRD